ncbi:tetratricopeptide repeat protein [Fontivita pretiosa]|uniref:tetratricopeptide repeat protein n=1 Tax=Fontivita pretiosa TaxID=2989684 RepID=UPI003D16AAED
MTQLQQQPGSTAAASGSLRAGDSSVSQQIEQGDLLGTTPDRLWPHVPLWSHALVAVALLLVVGLSFSNSFKSGMTLDNKYIIEEYYKALLRADPRHDLKSWKQIEYIFKNDYWWPKGISGLYRPVTTFTYWVDYVLLTGKPQYKTDDKGRVVRDAEGNPVPMSWYDYAHTPFRRLDTTSYHVINNVLHWINSILVYLVALMLLQRVWPAGFVAALFAAHPITTESVTNIIGRADMFAALVTFGGLLLYAKATRTRGSWALPWVVGLMLLTTFGLFAKESAAAVVLVLIVYDIAYRWRSDDPRHSGLLGLVKYALLYTLVMILLPALSGSILADAGVPQALPMPLRIALSIPFAAAVAYYIRMRATVGIRYASLAALLGAALVQTVAFGFVPVYVLALIGVVEFVLRWIGLHNTGRLAPLPMLIGHGVLYLLLVGALVGLPLAASLRAAEMDLLSRLPQAGRWIYAGVLAAVGLVVYAALWQFDRRLRVVSLVVIAVASSAAAFLVPYWPLTITAPIAAIELCRGSLTSPSARYRVVAHSTLYLALFFALIGLPILALWFFRWKGWDTWEPAGSTLSFHFWRWTDYLAWPISWLGLKEWAGWIERYLAASVVVLLGLSLHVLTASDQVRRWLNAHLGTRLPRALRPPGEVFAVPTARSSRVLALIGVAIASIIASFYSYWLGILLAVVVGVHELILGTLTPRRQHPEYARDWSLVWNGFALAYVAMIPPLIAMAAVRDWVFRNSSPAETPFLDNPIRGIWMVKELNVPGFDAELLAKPLIGLSFVECKLTAVKILGKLLWLLTYPAHLSADYSWHQIPNFSYTFGNGFEDVKAIVALVAVIAIFIVLPYYTYHRSRATFFFILFFFAAALPTSNLLVTIGSVMAERFMYLPLAGFTAVVVMAVFAGLRWLWERHQLTDPDDFPWHRFVAGSLLTLLVCVYGVRAWFRNFAWESDVTLWEAARQVADRSFRTYQSLAFAYYEQYVEKTVKGTPPKQLEGEIDRMIATAERAKPIVDVLPNHLNSSRLYLHLGMYYSLKGDLYTERRPDGSQVITSEARKWFQKAVDVLEQGSQVDRAFNEVNKAKQRLRGDPEKDITDAGLGPVYGTLGMAYTKLGQYDKALARLRYQRQLDPADIDPYLKIATVQLAQQRYDDAAVTLVQCILLDSARQEVWQTLIQLYGMAGERGLGTIVQENGQFKLNVSHPMVREHLCNAYREFVRVFRQAKRWQMAEDARKVAVDRYQFPRSLFDPLFEEKVLPVTPQGVQYD